MNGTVSVENLDWANVLAPLIVAIVVGVGSSYVTTRMHVSSIQQRLNQNEEDIIRLRSLGDARRKNGRELRERVIRMETKIDLLLQSEGIDATLSGENNP